MALFDTPIELSDELRDTPVDDTVDTSTSDTQKLILQDAECIVESINEAVRDLKTYERAYGHLQASKRAGIRIEQQIAVTQAQAIRVRLQGKYGTDVLATESVHTYSTPGGLTIALEEEEAKGKGFFAKIIDKIVEAFKWLWKKLTGLFSDGKDPEKIGESLEKTGEKLEKAVSGGAQINEAAIETFGPHKAFGFLGEPLTVEKITDYIKTTPGKIDPIKAACESANRAFDEYIAALKAVKDHNAEAYKGPFKHVGDLLNTTISHLGALGKAEDFDDAGGKGITDAVKGKSGAKIHTLDGFTGGYKLVFASYTNDKGNLEFKAQFGGKPAEVLKTEIKAAGGLSSYPLLRKAATDANEAFKKVHETFAKYIENRTKRLGELDALKNLVPGADSQAIGDIISLVGMYSQSIGNIVLASNTAYMHLLGGFDEVNKFLNEAIKSITADAPANEEAPTKTTEEPTAPEASPARKGKAKGGRKPKAATQTA